MSLPRIEFVDLIPLESIVPDPDSLRKELDQEHIQDLIESFNLLPMGPLDPLVVKPIKNGLYQIISGNHRYQALLEGGWKDAPCHVIEPLNDAEEFLMKLHANSKRKNLNDLEMCEALAREKAIYETFYTETKWGGNNQQSPCGKFCHTVNQPFTEVKAKTSGTAERTVRQDVKIGKVIQEIPELKEARASKMEAYAIARRKPEERLIVKKALQASSNKMETLRVFTRHEPKQPEESPGDYAYRYFKDAHRLLKQGIDWKSVSMEKLKDLVESNTLTELVQLLELEAGRIQAEITED